MARNNNADRALCALHSTLHSRRQLETPVRGTCHPECWGGRGSDLRQQNKQNSEFWVEPL